MAVLADLGYQGLALTPDVHHLDPLTTDEAAWTAFREHLDRHGLDVVLETGARFILDPARKHWPTLLDAPDDAAVRVAFLQRCVDQAVVLRAPVVTLWSGAAPEGLPHDEAYARLVDGLRRVCDYAADRDVRIGFEPEPGMLMERADAWPALREAVAHPALGLTLDVGHCLAMDEGSPADAVRAHRDDLLVLQLDDHRRGVHDHLAFGEGEVDFAAIAEAVRETGFAGPLEVELSRHASQAPRVAEASMRFLSAHFGD